jgi:hypothetical protein
MMRKKNLMMKESFITPKKPSDQMVVDIASHPDFVSHKLSTDGQLA